MAFRVYNLQTSKLLEPRPCLLPVNTLSKETDLSLIYINARVKKATARKKHVDLRQQRGPRLSTFIIWHVSLHEIGLDRLRTVSISGECWPSSPPRVTPRPDPLGAGQVSSWGIYTVQTIQIHFCRSCQRVVNLLLLKRANIKVSEKFITDVKRLWEWEDSISPDYEWR